MREAERRRRRARATAPRAGRSGRRRRPRDEPAPDRGAAGDSRAFRRRPWSVVESACVTRDRRSGRAGPGCRPGSPRSRCSVCWSLARGHRRTRLLERVESLAGATATSSCAASRRLLADRRRARRGRLDLGSVAASRPWRSSREHDRRRSPAASARTSAAAPRRCGRRAAVELGDPAAQALDALVGSSTRRHGRLRPPGARRRRAAARRGLRWLGPAVFRGRQRRLRHRGEPSQPRALARPALAGLERRPPAPRPRARRRCCRRRSRPRGTPSAAIAERLPLRQYEDDRAVSRHLRRAAGELVQLDVAAPAMRPRLPLLVGADVDQLASPDRAARRRARARALRVRSVVAARRSDRARIRRHRATPSLD